MKATKHTTYWLEYMPKTNRWLPLSAPHAQLKTVRKRQKKLNPGFAHRTRIMRAVTETSVVEDHEIR